MKIPQFDLTRQYEQIAIAFQLARMIAEPLAPEVALCEPAALDHRAHCAVKEQDACLEQGVQPFGCRHHRPSDLG